MTRNNKEKPILFNGDMVRAILEGRKTQTRRIMKVQPSDPDMKMLQQVSGADSKNDRKWHWGLLSEDRNRVLKSDKEFFNIPYGQVGDQLWVRETFYEPNDQVVIYKANWQEDAESRGLDNIPDSVDWKWKPSIHMPRWASRIQLKITDIRVEQLQDISEQDALKEGMTGRIDGLRLPSEEFESLWESINGEVSWDENPWVWVVEFESIEDDTE